MGDRGREPTLDPNAAAARIEQAQRYVRSNRRWYAAGWLITGLAAITYFAAIGTVPASRQPPALTWAVTVALLVVVAIVIIIRSRHRLPGGPSLARAERWLGVLFSVLAVPAGQVSLWLPHPSPSMLVGVVPAVPALVLAWLLWGR